MAETLSMAVEAMALCCGYNIGFFNKSDIEEWAEEQIAAVAQPADALIDLAILRDTHPLDVMTLLKSLGGSLPAAQLIATQIGFLGICFETGKGTPVATIRGLFALVHESGISSEEIASIYWLDDAYDLAVAGTYGSMAEVESELRKFVAPYAESLRDQLAPLLPGS